MLKSLCERFEENINADYFDIIDCSEYEMIENNSGGKKPYSIFLNNVCKGDERVIAVKGMEALSNPNIAGYLKNQPKNCDYGMIDLHRKTVFLFELKENKSKGKTADSIAEQLLSGERWLDHLVHCASFEAFDEIKHWKRKRVVINFCKGRKPKGKPPRKVFHGKSYYVCRGNQVYDLAKIAHLK